MAHALGKHLLLELHGCPRHVLNDISALEKHMVQAAREAGATVINTTFHHFSPLGVSGVVVIQESHLSIHTWPEFGFAAIDLFTCGENTDPWRACVYLKKALQATGGDAQEMARGQFFQRKTSARSPKGPILHQLWFTEKNENIALSLRHAGVVFDSQSPFQKVQILNTYGYGNMLVLDGHVMCTERDECVYHEMIAHIPALLHPHPKTALVIGGGDGGAVRELCRHPSLSAITVAEIDETVVQAAHQHLPQLAAGFNDPRVTLKIANGIDLINQTPEETCDLILIDAPGQDGPAEPLTSAAFYKQIRHCLTPQGILVAQIPPPTLSDSAFPQIFHRLQSAFLPHRVYPYFAFIPTYATGMVGFLLASKGNHHPVQNLDHQRAIQLSQTHPLRYYTPEIHAASFALPPFIKTMLNQQTDK